MPRQVAADPGVEEGAQVWAKRILRAEMARRGIGSKELAEKLDEMGFHENERNLSNKIARGKFSAGFMLLCLRAMGCRTLDVRDSAQRD